MAINIYQGGKNTSKPARVNEASASTRAKNLQENMAKTGVTANVTSDSGSTAVKSGGILSKMGSLAKKVIPVAAKYAPGMIGSVAKVAESVFNDPEWWQTVPGEGITLNQPLADIAYGVTVQGTQNTAHHIRPAILAFSTYRVDAHPTENYIINPTEQMVTQYLMPEVRKVVNAVPLQAAADYKTVLQVNATIYALWRNMLRYDYMLKHGQTYIPNLNDDMFPVLQVANASWLQSTINRLEEYLRANVRLPHTLCEYLAWRFGRVYKVNDTAKAACVTYNVMPMLTSIDEYNQFIAALMQTISSTPALQAANADLFNVYFSHDLTVEIRDETQFSYDMKEFALRTNLDAYGSEANIVSDPNLIAIDSELDNPTTFMASTVSTVVESPIATDGLSALFPVVDAGVYLYCRDAQSAVHAYYDMPTPFVPMPRTEQFWTPPMRAYLKKVMTPRGNWVTVSLDPQVLETIDTSSGPNLTIENTRVLAINVFFLKLALAKAVEYYNAGLYARHCRVHFMEGVSEAIPVNVVEDGLWDMTALSMDLGLSTDVTVGIEQVFAFANLVTTKHQTSLTYKAAEKLVARDVANTIEQIDVATTA